MDSKSLTKKILLLPAKYLSLVSFITSLQGILWFWAVVYYLKIRHYFVLEILVIKPCYFFGSLNSL